MKLTIHDDPEVLTERTRALKKLKTIKVKVGLPPSAGDRLHFILAVQEHGSPIMHLPSRPVIHPALAKDETRAEMAKAMKAAIASAWEGKTPWPDLEATGQACADGICAYVDFHIPPPNSPATVNGGWIWNRVAKKAVYVKGKGFNKLLFDTGNPYNAFGYEIEE